MLLLLLELLLLGSLSFLSFRELLFLSFFAFGDALAVLLWFAAPCSRSLSRSFVLDDPLLLPFNAIAAAAAAAAAAADAPPLADEECATLPGRTTPEDARGFPCKADESSGARIPGTEAF
jgi:hypothetical protein